MADLSSPLLSLRWGTIILNIIQIMLGLVIFAMCIWLKSDSGFSSWLSDLELENYYIGIYIILIGAIIYLVGSCVGIVATSRGSATVLKVMVGIYVFEFVCCVIGSALLLDHATYDSKIQPLIRKSMLYLISESQWERHSELLGLIQENIGCCGADGPEDYIAWKKPLPTECRDSVTGNAFFHGCVDELTWFLQDKSEWLSGIVMVAAFLFVLKSVFTIHLIKIVNAIKNNT